MGNYLPLFLTIIAGVEGGIIFSLRLLYKEMDNSMKHTLETISYHVLLITIIILLIWR